MPVAGEWARCRYHNRKKFYRFGHSVDNTIQRWQTFGKNDEVVDRAERGVGTLRLRPAGATLLYQKGYARPWRGVLRLIPSAVRKAVQRLGGARLRKPTAEAAGVPNLRPPAEAGQSRREDLAEGLETVVRATQFAVGTFCFAVLVTLISILFTGITQTVLQYLATLGFVLAWAATSSGIYSRAETWLKGACWKAAKWWGGIFVPVALINMVFTVANK